MIRIAMATTGLALGMIITSAFAQTPTPQQRAACEGDVRKLCSSISPGGGRLIKCLSEQKDKVSEACRKSLSI